MQVNWKRGALRVWVVLSVLWFAAIALVTFENAPVRSLVPIHTTVHVKISNKETWDYPSEIGVEAIRADIRKRLRDQDAADRAWAATLSKAENIYSF